VVVVIWARVPGANAVDVVVQTRGNLTFNIFATDMEPSYTPSSRMGLAATGPVRVDALRASKPKADAVAPRLPVGLTTDKIAAGSMGGDHSRNRSCCANRR
jgi:hypothetical protein